MLDRKIEEVGLEMDVVLDLVLQGGAVFLVEQIILLIFLCSAMLSMLFFIRNILSLGFPPMSRSS